MKKTLFFIILILMVVSKSSAQTHLYSLEIQIVGLKSNTGKILLQLFTNKNKIISKKHAKINNKKCTLSIKNLKLGNYLVNYFHDENENKKLDSNWLGIPSEGYGFSNNASGTFGIPSIKDRLFNINRNTIITLTINY
ncbi:MAG: DUF2141 domain-containing protein [Bacteroidetes bacterium]|nr:DUF2141 domain-containing protein [Bacteroidota bacterium]